ncbi:hypothetical protein ACQ86N_44385 [Puia sp. P3]|uniref:hypothetical protein n=1 Tax=Puia sp. P3 TaxID=3423952 RepID=UPI003D66DDA8
MKKIININFHSRVIPIEESAYEILQQYISSLRRYFANEEGRDEIISDIENRFAELFSETLKKGAACITDADVNTIIASMGRPEEFEGEEAPSPGQLPLPVSKLVPAPTGSPPAQVTNPAASTAPITTRSSGGVCGGTGQLSPPRPCHCAYHLRADYVWLGRRLPALSYSVDRTSY